MGFSDYIVYADESGDHSLDSIDPKYPMFVLAFCIVRKEEYIVPVRDLLSLKFEFFGHDMVIMHDREIRKRLGDFRILNDASTRHAFLARISDFVTAAPFTLVASAIHKQRHCAQYATPRNPYAMALKFCLERTYGFLKDHRQLGGTTQIVVESRGRAEDDALELEFRRTVAGANYWSAAMPFEVRFTDKKANSTGLQLADLVSRPIGQEVLAPGSQARIWPIIDAKFRRSRSGKVSGYGLKVFP